MLCLLDLSKCFDMIDHEVLMQMQLLMAMLDAGRHLKSRISDTEQKILSAINDVKPSISAEFEQIRIRIEKIEKSFSEIKEQQTRVEHSVQEQHQAVQEMPKFSKVLKNSAEQIRKIVETKEKEGREVNLILHNIPESKSEDAGQRRKYDADSFYNIAFALYGDTKGFEVEQIFRLGKKPDSSNIGSEPKSRLTLVKLKSKESVDLMIKRRTKLKDVGFPNIYITRDLTPEERIKQKCLREELRQKGRDTHVIFWGQVIPKAFQD